LIFSMKTALFSILITQVNAFLLYKVKLSMIPSVSNSIVSIIDAVNTFNKEVNEKRREKVQAISGVKEVIETGTAKFDLDKFKKMSVIEQSEVVFKSEVWKSINPPD